MNFSLTNPQKSIWLTEKFFTGTAINNISGYTYISDNVNFDILKNAINEVIRTNDSMRIKLLETDTECIQFFDDFTEINFDKIKLSSIDDVKNTALNFAKIPFDINNNLLFKFVLFELPNNSGGFFLTCHHIIGDSWGLGLIVKEIINNYSNLLNNNYKDVQTPSYIDYINAENSYLNSDKFNIDKKYWDNTFSTIPDPISIPSYKFDSLTKSCNGNRINFSIPENKMIEIKKFCKENKISLYNFFMAIYSIYIGKINEQDDFVIGTPILNRTSFEQKHTTGMFISTSPLRINLNHKLTFLEFVQNIATNTISLFRHQKYPYQYILNDLRKKDSTIPNLYNIVLSYQITKTFDNESGINYKAEWVTNGYCADDLQIHLFDLNDESSLTVAYDFKTDKYNENDISSLHLRILTIINQIINNNNILLKDIEIVTLEEKNKILYDFNNTKKDFPLDKTIVDLFEEQALKTPNNIAVVFENQQLTYKELNEKSNQLARYLNKIGITHGDSISILLNKNIDFIISVFAVLKIGAIYVPIYTKYPNERIKYIIQDSDSKLLITSKKFISEEINHINFLLIENYNELLNKYDKSNSEKKYSPNDIIYTIYTSGSTGTPKGIKIANSNLINFIYSFNNYFNNVTEKDNFLSSTSISFDVSIFEIFLPLCFGSKLFLNNKDIITNIFDFCDQIIVNNINALYIPPNILDDVYSIFLQKNYFGINKLLVGVEPISNTTLNKFYNLNKSMIIINGYGPSETTICATALKYIKDESNSRIVSIGRPLFNNNIYILSKELSLMPVDVPGEICISGEGVGFGYINNNNNNNSFINNPFFNNSKMYRTGDFAKWNLDGTISFIGRKDNQAKISGYRIELNEINYNIQTISGIKKSIVRIIDNKNLACYFISDIKINGENLKSKLKNKLPIYMIPKYFIQIDSFPTNVNGKIDYSKLPLPNMLKDSNINTPTNNTEQIILDILIEFTLNKNISIDDDFSLSLFLDSLDYIKLSTKLYNIFNVSIPTFDLMKLGTIRNLSKKIEEIKIQRIKPISKKNFYSISSAQKRIYYSNNLYQNSILYNTPGGIILDGSLDIKKLENCFKILIDRHDSLRTSFDIVNNNVVQMVNEKIDFEIKLENANNDNVYELFKGFVKPFDLFKAPLFRIKLYVLKNGKILFLIDMHHIISDGTSLTILMQELCSLYNNHYLSNKEIDYKDFVCWEQEQFKSTKFELSKQFWLNKFKDEIPILNIDTSYRRPIEKSFEGSNYYIKLSSDLFNKINLTAKQLKITPYMLMLSCYYILLSKYTGQEDIVVGTPTIGRDLPELSNIIGMFVNTLPLRNYVDYKLTFTQFANIVKNNCLACFENQIYPFDLLVKDLNIKRDISRSPLFDTMFIFQNNGYPNINLNGLKAEYFIPNSNISKYDISLEVIPIQNEYSLRFEYCTKLFDEEFIKNFAIHYENILLAILKNTEIKLSNINMLSKEEKNKILNDFNNTYIDLPTNKTIVDLFEEQVDKTPDNVAIVFEDEQLSYKELNCKANKLAKHLQSLGATENTVIGIMLPRSLDIMIAILGALKAGCCYIPIDPCFPKERIEYMLGDSNASILIKNSNVQTVNFNTIINMEDLALCNYDSENLNITISQDSCSYIIYTSGSTGRPKGVVLKHKSLLNLAYYLNKNVEYFNDSYKNIAIASITTISFDIFLFETLLSLQRGLKIIIANEKEQTNPTLLDKLINKHNIKAIQMTPSRMEIFINNKEYMPHLSNLKYITLAGEALSYELKEKILELGNIIIYNGYGPSETTVFSTFTNATFQKNITIGKPISNTHMYVLDKDKHICPINVPGELYISGDGVGFGYYNNPKLTKKYFVKDTFNKGLIMYKTGDLVKLLPNYELSYIGRKDNQVKIRGLRIELDEIQKWINKYPNISKSIVYSCKDKNSRQYIVAYLTVKNRISINDLKIFLGKYMPKYMVPSYFIILDNFPYLPNGKINRNALPVPDETISSNRKYVAPTSNLELDIAQAFENLLSITPISIDDNFFDMGGDSLLAMSLQLELLKLNIKITYSDIFMYPTVRELANNVSSNSKLSLTNIDTSEFIKFNEILDKTTTFTEIKYQVTGNLLLAGITGFLGAHILDSFIKNEKGKVYCLIRTEPGLTVERKLMNKLHYYFNKKYDFLIGKRIIPINADIAINKLGLTDPELDELSQNIDIVINSAAKVSHYGDYSEYKRVNVDGTQNLIDFCMKYNKRFYQISTISISGNSLADSSFIKQNFNENIDFYENNFYINQSLDNVYIRSKFEAEKVVLSGILNGLDGYIIRVGNLMNRLSDGRFQPNKDENAYVNRIISFAKLKCIPDYITDGYLEITPVDCCANAIIKLIGHPCSQNRIFHLLNHNTVSIPKFISVFNSIYGKIDILSSDKFLDKFHSVLYSNDSKKILSGIINDLDENKKLVYNTKINIKSDFSVAYLKNIGFEWPIINDTYLDNFLHCFLK